MYSSFFGGELTSDYFRLMTEKLCFDFMNWNFPRKLNQNKMLSSWVIQNVPWQEIFVLVEIRNWTCVESVIHWVQATIGPQGNTLAGFLLNQQKFLSIYYSYKYREVV